MHLQDTRPLLYRAVSVTFLLLLAGFVVLSIDVLVRVWAMRQGLPSGADAAVLLAYEAARAVTTALALVLAAMSYRRADTAGRRAATLVLLFLAVWYTKAFAFESFPGHLQERLANVLFRHGVSRRAMYLLFGAPVWAAWLALAALVRVSVTFPGPLDPGLIERSGARDRAGLLRGVSLAGLDVGGHLRAVSAALLRRGAYAGGPVWLLAIAAGLLHAMSDSGPIRIGLAAGFAFTAMLAVTNLRAATQGMSDGDRRRILWLLQASIVGAAAFAAGAVLSAAGTRVTEGLSFGLAALAPPMVLMGLAYGIAHRQPPNPRVAIANTTLIGVAALAAAAFFVAAGSILGPRTATPLATLLPLVVAAAGTGVIWSRLRRLAGRLSAAALADAAR